MSEQSKVAAVVVTYNRKALLRECLNALLAQTRPLDEIIVVDNASTDGTDRLIKEEFLQFSQVTYLRLPENIGGAGGFHEGMKLAYEKGYDWIWVMDDDVIPFKDALELLFVYTHKFRALVPSVRKTEAVDQYDERVLGTVIAKEKVFGGTILSIKDFYQETLQISAYPLLGILIERSVLKDIGFVNPAFFSQGDDIDFTLRISRKFPILWVKNSIVLHFSSNEPFYTRISFLGKTFYILRSDQLWKSYYNLRNSVYLMRSYFGFRRALIYALRQLPKDLIKYTIAGPHYWFALKLYVEAFFDGLYGRLGRHSKYLPKN